MSAEINVVPVPLRERGKYSDIVVGQASCPDCEQVALVKNDRPEKQETDNYFDDHWKDNTFEELCRNSGRPLTMCYGS